MWQPGMCFSTMTLGCTDAGWKSDESDEGGESDESDESDGSDGEARTNGAARADLAGAVGRAAPRQREEPPGLRAGPLR